MREKYKSSKRRVSENETEESRPTGLRRHTRVFKLSCFLFSGHKNRDRERVVRETGEITSNSERGERKMKCKRNKERGIREVKEIDKTHTHTKKEKENKGKERKKKKKKKRKKTKEKNIKK